MKSTDFSEDISASKPPLRSVRLCEILDTPQVCKCWFLKLSLKKTKQTKTKNLSRRTNQSSYIRILEVHLHLKGYSENLWAGVHFFPHILILLYILKELSYTNLTSIGLLQKQNGFDKIDRSVQVFNFYVLKKKVQYSIQWRSKIHIILFRISRQCKIIANRNFEPELSNWVFVDGCQLLLLDHHVWNRSMNRR